MVQDKDKIHYSSKSDEWETPDNVFKTLDREFKFTLDPSSTHINAKCNHHFTKDEDGLSLAWSGSVFMNPPYGRSISKWVQKAYEESRSNAEVVVCLVPSRTDTAWWHKYCINAAVRFVRGRLRFINRTFPSWREDGNFKVSPAGFPSAVVVFAKDMKPSSSSIKF